MGTAVSLQQNGRVSKERHAESVSFFWASAAFGRSARPGSVELWRISARACLKNVNMPNRRVFCPLDGAIFP